MGDKDGGPFPPINQFPHCHGMIFRAQSGVRFSSPHTLLNPWMEEQARVRIPNPPPRPPPSRASSFPRFLRFALAI